MPFSSFLLSSLQAITFVEFSWYFLSNFALLMGSILLIRILLHKKPDYKILRIVLAFVLMFVLTIVGVVISKQYQIDKENSLLSLANFLLIIMPCMIYISVLYHPVQFSYFLTAFVFQVYESLGMAVLCSINENFADKYLDTGDIVYVSKADTALRSFLLLTLIVWMIITNNRDRKEIYYSKKWLWIIIPSLVLLVFTIVFLVFVLIYRDKTVLPVVLFGTVFGIVLYLVVTLLFSMLSRSARKTQEQKYELLQYESVQERNKEIFAAYHDYQNNLQSIAHFLDRNDVQGASEYMKDLLGDIPSGESVYLTGNTYLDRFLSGQQSIASKLNVDIAFFGVFPTEGIRNMDICTCFGNALKNAIEACGAQKKVNKVTVKSKIVHDRVYVQIINPIVESKAIRLTDYGAHGYGLPNIENTVQKYDGQMLINTDNPEEFTLSFDLQFKK